MSRPLSSRRVDRLIQSSAAVNIRVVSAGQLPVIMRVVTLLEVNDEELTVRLSDGSMTSVKRKNVRSAEAFASLRHLARRAGRVLDILGFTR